jgi:uncharacterized protein (DUF58 family)
MTAHAPRISLRPTATGVCWLLAVLALLATAVNYGNNLIFALAFLQLAVILQAAWNCRRNLVDVDWHADNDDSIAAATPFTCVGKLIERAQRPHRRIVLRHDHPGGSREGAATDLGSAARQELAVELTGLPRGHHLLAGLALTSTHPLGLWRARRPLPSVDLLVHPRPQGRRSLPGALPRPAHQRQETGDFQGLRTYAPGDPPRRINWRVYGRRGELAVNRFDGGTGGDVLWLSPEQADGELERRLGQLARWVLEAERCGREYGLRIGNAVAPPARGRPQRIACLRLLALHAPQA